MTARKKTAKKKATRKKTPKKKATKKKVAKKKSAAKSEASEGLSRSEVKQAVSKIKKFLKQRDYDAIDTGIELARSLGEPEVFEAFLEGCAIGASDKYDYWPSRSIRDGDARIKYDKAQLIRNKAFSGTEPAEPYLDYALVGLIANAPESKRLHESLHPAKITTLSLCGKEWTRLPPGLDKLENLTGLHVFLSQTLKEVDVLGRCQKLTSLNIDNCEGIENLDSLANCESLIDLDLGCCRSLNFLTGCKELTRLNLDYGSSTLQNLDELANCKKLEELHLSNCDLLENVDGLGECTRLTRLSMGAGRLENVDGLARCTKLTDLQLGSIDNRGDALQNVDGLAGCTDLASVQLTGCESLENVSGLAGCAKLTYLFIYMCDRVVPQPPTAALTSRKKIAAYQKLLKA